MKSKISRVSGSGIHRLQDQELPIEWNGNPHRTTTISADITVKWCVVSVSHHIVLLNPHGVVFDQVPEILARIVRSRPTIVRDTLAMKHALSGTDV